MRILMLDIETAPNLAYVWQLFDQNIGPKQLVHGTSVLSWAAKWYGEDHIMFDSVKRSSESRMLWRMHRLLDQADVVVHFYGSKFDIPMLNSQFVKRRWAPPAPYKQVDLKKICSEQFRFPSNKLEYVAKELGCGEKLDYGVDAFTLWRRCMAGDKAAWEIMRKYNIQDVVLLEKLYDKLMPWIKNHPNHGSYNKDNKEVCTNCGGTHYQRRGTTIAKLLKYARFQCQDCGTWFRSNIAIPNLKRVKRLVSI